MTSFTKHYIIYITTLQQVIITKCASEVFTPVHGRKTPPAQVAKQRDQHQDKLKWVAPTTCNYNHHHHQPDQDQDGCRWSDRSTQQSMQLAQGHTISVSVCLFHFLGQWMFFSFVFSLSSLGDVKGLLGTFLTCDNIDRVISGVVVLTCSLLWTSSALAPEGYSM